MFWKPSTFLMLVWFQKKKAKNSRSLTKRKSKFSRTITTRTTLKRPRVSNTNGYDFKHEIFTLNKKWISFKSQLKNNKIELKSTSTKWSLKQIVKRYAEMDEFKEIAFLANMSLTVPVTNAWPECGASAVKRVKSHTRSTMKNDLLNALLNISINGSAYNSKEAKQLISEVAVKTTKKSK